MRKKLFSAVVGLASCMAIGVASAADPNEPVVLSGAQMDSITAAGGGYDGNNGSNGKGKKHGHFKKKHKFCPGGDVQLGVQTNIIIFANTGDIDIRGGIRQTNRLMQRM